MLDSAVPDVFRMCCVSRKGEGGEFPNHGTRQLREDSDDLARRSEITRDKTSATPVATGERSNDSRVGVFRFTIRFSRDFVRGQDRETTSTPEIRKNVQS